MRSIFKKSEKYLSIDLLTCNVLFRKVFAYVITLCNCLCNILIAPYLKKSYTWDPVPVEKKIRKINFSRRNIHFKQMSCLSDPLTSYMIFQSLRSCLTVDLPVKVICTGLGLGLVIYTLFFGSILTCSVFLWRLYAWIRLKC